jgi:anti-anti-sigma factor
MLESAMQQPYCAEQKREAAPHLARRGTEVMTMTAQLPVSSHALGIAVSHSDGRTVIALTGSVDAATAPKLAAELAASARHGRNEMELDLSQLDFMDSGGRSVIVAAHKRVQRSGGSLTILSPNRRVIRLIQLGGLMSYLIVNPRMSL